MQLIHKLFKGEMHCSVIFLSKHSRHLNVTGTLFPAIKKQNTKKKTRKAYLGCVLPPVGPQEIQLFKTNFNQEDMIPT